jgi:hypothetical protein
VKNVNNRDSVCPSMRSAIQEVYFSGLYKYISTFKRLLISFNSVCWEVNIKLFSAVFLRSDLKKCKVWL